MSKTGWKHRLLSGLLCAALVFQNLSLSASATGSADSSAENTVEVQTETAQETETEQESSMISSQKDAEAGGTEEATIDDRIDETPETDTTDGQNIEPAVSDSMADSGEEAATEEILELVSEPEEDTTTVKMTSDAGSFIGKIDMSEIEISGVNRNNAKWIEFKPSEAGTYHIYTTNDGTNTYGDPLVAVYTIKNDKVEKDKAATGFDENIAIADNNDGHNYKNFYAFLTVSEEQAAAGTSWFIFAGSGSSETEEQTKYKLHVEKEGPIRDGDVQSVEADKPVTVSGVSQYKYGWLSFTAPEDGIYKFELTGDARNEGTIRTYAEKSEDAQPFSSDFVTMRKGQTMYARAYAAEDEKTYDEYEDKENQKRRAYDTVSFDVKAVTAARLDSFVLDVSKITSEGAEISSDYIGDINFQFHQNISYKKHEEDESGYTTVDGAKITAGPLEPGTVYDVQVQIYSDARMKENAAQDAKEAALILTDSFVTKTEKPVNYTLNEAVDGYTLRAVIEQVTGGFKITNLKVEKSGSDNNGSTDVTVSISYKESTAEDDQYASIGSVACPPGADIRVEDCEKDGLYLGGDYKLKFEIQDDTVQKQLEKLVQAGNWPAALEPAEKRGYGSFVLDFSQVPVKPLRTVIKYVNESGTETSLSALQTSDRRIWSCDIRNMVNTDPYDLIMEVTDADGNTGRKNLTTKLTGWNKEDITVQIGQTSYNEDKAGMNVPVTISASAQAMPFLAVQAVFTTDEGSEKSEMVPVKDGKAELVIPGLNAGTEGTVTVTVYEDRYLGTYSGGSVYNVTLVSYTPTEQRDGIEEDKVYTVGKSALYTADIVPEAQIDSARYSVSVSKLRLGGEVRTVIEYAPETKADADNSIEAVSAAKKLEEGTADVETVEGPDFCFDEGKDPVAENGTLTFLQPDHEYACRLKLYNTDGILLCTSEIKTFKTLPVSSLVAEQTVKFGEGKDYYKTVTLNVAFNMTVNSTTAGKVTVKYRKRGGKDSRGMG